jgi:[acyl-carrier-protein] S-malonyltransferase
MGKDLYESSDAARKVFDTADRVLGYSISNICFNGSNEELMKTINSQPCILAVSIAAYEALKEKTDITPYCCAGHSLGEYAALYATGAVDLGTIFMLIHKRASLMNDAAMNTNGSMAAVIGLDNDTVINIVKDIDNVYVANFNSPGQVVITGGKEQIETNLDKFKEAGAKKVIPLSVSGAFHSPLMKNAGELFAQYINDIKFNDIDIPVYTNVDANAEKNGSELKNKLPKQIYSSVLWTQTINNIQKSGINDFIEIGPGKVLAGLNKKINPEINTLNVNDIETLNMVVSEIKEKEPV